MNMRVDISPADAAAELLARRKARDNLLSFTEYTHPNWASGEHHKRICEALERVERGEIKRLMIFAPPRHSKSELASKRFPGWYLGRHPDHQIICCSHTADLATDFGADVRDIVNVANVYTDEWLDTNAQADADVRHEAAELAEVIVEVGKQIIGLEFPTAIGNQVCDTHAQIILSVTIDSGCVIACIFVKKIPWPINPCEPHH